MEVNKAYKRCVRGYPSPVYKMLVVGAALQNETTESKIVNQAIKEMFDRMPKDERKRLLALVTAQQ